VLQKFPYSCVQVQALIGSLRRIKNDVSASLVVEPIGQPSIPSQRALPPGSHWGTAPKPLFLPCHAYALHAHVCVC